MASSSQIMAGQSQGLIGCSSHCAFRGIPSRVVVPRRLRLTTVNLAKGQSYHVEVEVSEDEDPEGVFKRFRNSCNLSGMVYEARRRRVFENKQDIIKRKQQEKGMRKMRDIREKFLETFDDTNSDTPPFTDMFASEDDIFGEDRAFGQSNGVTRGPNGAQLREGGVTSMAGDRKDYRKTDDFQAVKSLDALDRRTEPQQNDARGGAANVSRRQIPSRGPFAGEDLSDGKQLSDRQNGQKPRQQIDTARSRRANKAKAGGKTGGRTVGQSGGPTKGAGAPARK